MVTNYQTLYKQAVDKASPDYRAPFNTIASLANVATPDDKFVVTPNSDTPYSFLWMDLRAEPIIVTMPKIEKNRYYTGQMIDLYTFNFAYLGSRSYGNDGGTFMITGPGWKGDTPKGVRAVMHSETQFAYILFRTQLFNPADLPNVKKIQAGYHAQTLSQYLKQPAPPAAPTVDWPKPKEDALTTPALFNYLNFMLQFCPANSSETELMERFSRLNIGAGKNFDFTKFSPEAQQAVKDGIADASRISPHLSRRSTLTKSPVPIFSAREPSSRTITSIAMLAPSWDSMATLAKTPSILPISSTPTISHSMPRSPATPCNFPRDNCRPPRPSGPSPCTTAKSSCLSQIRSSATCSTPPC